MDLCEHKKNLELRHPWESARLRALESLVKRIPSSQASLRVLDVGCGDGFIIQELAKKNCFKSMTGIDIHMSNEQREKIANFGNNIICYNDYAHLKGHYYDLILLLDVIEHVTDDKTFLSNIVKKYVAPAGYMVIMAPAFQFLFSSHDRFLKHYRRYNQKNLLELIETAHLKILASGYFFMSLFLVRLFLSCYERLILRDGMDNNVGIGDWNHAGVVTKVIELILRGDNSLSIALNQLGLKIPGLSVWALCKRQLS
jgi:SAM-dependent methyltransferase